MINNMGIEWALTLLGCLAALCVPVPILFIIYGKRLRAKSEYNPMKLMAPKPEHKDSVESNGSKKDAEKIEKKQDV
jgi:MFS transporter, DHA1 family, multidrug resistance protein